MNHPFIPTDTFGVLRSGINPLQSSVEELRSKTIADINNYYERTKTTARRDLRESLAARGIIGSPMAVDIEADVMAEYDRESSFKKAVFTAQLTNQFATMMESLRFQREALTARTATERERIALQREALRLGRARPPVWSGMRIPSVEAQKLSKREKRERLIYGGLTKVEYDARIQQQKVFDAQLEFYDDLKKVLTGEGVTQEKADDTIKKLGLTKGERDKLSERQADLARKQYARNLRLGWRAKEDYWRREPATVKRGLIAHRDALAGMLSSAKKAGTDTAQIDRAIIATDDAIRGFNKFDFEQGSRKNNIDITEAGVPQPTNVRIPGLEHISDAEVKLSPIRGGDVAAPLITSGWADSYPNPSPQYTAGGFAGGNVNITGGSISLPETSLVQVMKQAIPDIVGNGGGLMSSDLTKGIV